VVRVRSRESSCFYSFSLFFFDGDDVCIPENFSGGKRIRILCRESEKKDEKSVYIWSWIGIIRYVKDVAMKQI
jgi:hypothetical protein